MPLRKTRRRAKRSAGLVLFVLSITFRYHWSIHPSIHPSIDQSIHSSAHPSDSVSSRRLREHDLLKTLSYVRLPEIDFIDNGDGDGDDDSQPFVENDLASDSFVAKKMDAQLTWTCDLGCATKQRNKETNK